MGDIRGLGAMIAFELVTEHGGNKPDAAAAKALAAEMPGARPADPDLRRLQRYHTTAVPAVGAGKDRRGRPRYPRGRAHRKLIPL